MSNIKSSITQTAMIFCYFIFYVETLNKRWINLHLLIQMPQNVLTFYDMGKSHLTVLNILDLWWNQKDSEKLVKVTHNSLTYNS